MKPAHVRIFFSLTGLIAFAALCYYFNNVSLTAFFNFPLDDAWIHQVYAHALAFGHGFAYNKNGPQQTGFSSPLWAIINAPCEWLSLISTHALVIAVKTLGFLLGAMSLVLLYRITLLLSDNTLCAFIATIIGACSSVFLFSLFSGMEDALFVTLWLAWCYNCLKHNYTLAAIFLGLCTITRPESLILIPFFILLLLKSAKYQSIKNYRIVLWCFLPFCAWVAFCLWATGYPLPSTFYAKAHVGGNVFLYNLAQITTIFKQSDYAQSLLFYIVLIFGALMLARKKSSQANTALLTLLLAPIIYILAIMLSRPLAYTGYYSRRYVDPALIILFFFFAINVSLTIKLKRLYSILCLALFVAFFALPQWRLINIQRLKLALASLSIYHVDVQPGLWINQHTATNAVIGVNDAGAIRYFGQRTTIDLMGLNNSAIAHNSESAKHLVKSINWLTIFPFWAKQYRAFFGFRYINLNQFKPVIALGTKTPSDYVICTAINSFNSQCANQYQTIIFKKVDNK